MRCEVVRFGDETGQTRSNDLLWRGRSQHHGDVLNLPGLVEQTGQRAELALARLHLQAELSQWHAIELEAPMRVAEQAAPKLARIRVRKKVHCGPPHWWAAVARDNYTHHRAAPAE